MNPRLMRPTQSSKFAALRNGLTNYWPLNEDAPSGNVSGVNFVSGGTSMTSDNSVASIAGKINNARTFVSANSQRMSATATASMVLLGTSDYTLSFWFRMTSAYVSGNQGLVTNDFFSTQRGVSIYATGSAGNWYRPYMNLQYADATEETFAPFDATSMAISAWHFVCVRLSGGTTLDVRFNTNDATPKAITKAFFSTRQRLFFGVRYTTSDYLNGDLDEVAMWNRRLTDAEVSQLYNSGAGIDLRK